MPDPSPPPGLSVKAPPTLSGQAAATGTAGAFMVLIEQTLWQFWGISLTNETVAALMILFPVFVHWLSRCTACQKFLGMSPPANVVITPTSAEQGSNTGVAA